MPLTKFVWSSVDLHFSPLRFLEALLVDGLGISETIAVHRHTWPNCFGK